MLQFFNIILQHKKCTQVHDKCPYMTLKTFYKNHFYE